MVLCSLLRASVCHSRSIEQVRGSSSEVIFVGTRNGSLVRHEATTRDSTGVQESARGPAALWVKQITRIWLPHSTETVMVSLASAKTLRNRLSVISLSK